MKSTARVVVVGGGVVGVGILYGLTMHGWRDVVLCERRELTSGSTWHAAGLVQHYVHNRTLARLVQKSIEIYKSLEVETGQAVGWHGCGSLRLASRDSRVDEYRKYMDRAAALGFRAELVSPRQAQRLWPLLDLPERVRAGVYNPDDGHIAPADVTMALAAGARQRGGEIYRQTEVTGLARTRSGEWKVVTDKGEILCEHVVLATGLFARQTAALVGLDIPTVPIVHQYVVSEPIPELAEHRANGHQELPILKDEICNGYVREEHKGLIFGPYERGTDLELFAVDGVPPDFAGQLLPAKLAPVEGHIEEVVRLIPCLGRVGIRSNVRGPISLSPDFLPLVGPAQGLSNLWLAEGVAAGPTWGGGIGHHLAEWIMSGEASVDLSDIDPRRFGGFATKGYACRRNREVFGRILGVFYNDHQWETARGLKRWPVHDRYTRAGAVWGSVYGWEVPSWFAPEGVEAKDHYSYRRANDFPYVGEECRAVRRTVGLMNLSNIGKYELSGPGAEAFLDRFVANRLPPEVGRMRLCHHLTEQGGVAAEFTVTRLAADRLYLVGSGRQQRHDLDLLRRALPRDGSVSLCDVTTSRGAFSIAGPRSRTLLERLVDFDLSNAAFPWLSGRIANVALAEDVVLLRTSYAGELGWELHHPIEYQLHLYDEILEAGRDLSLRHIGERAIESMRLDKSYRAILRDLTKERSLLEAGLESLVGFDKGDFIGRAALLRQQAAGFARRFAVLRVEPGDTDANREEAIYHGNELVGAVASGGYSHTLGTLLAHAYLPLDSANPGTKLAVSVLGERRPAEVIPESPFDPENLRPRGLDVG
jgi:dimethylglycine dehydrogenase